MSDGQTALAEASELSFRLATVRAGMRVALAMATGLLAYTLLSWGGPHREFLVVLCLAIGVETAAVTLVPHRSLALEGRHDAFLFSWNAVHVAAAAVGATLDGGPGSPIVLVMFVSVAFAAVSLPRPAVYGIAALDVAALLTVAAVADRWPPSLAFSIMALVVVALVGAGGAGDRWRRGTALQAAHDEMLERLARVIEYRDNDTGEHIGRMSEYCAIIARSLGFTPAAASELRIAATMHDVGKVGVPDGILLKAGPLTPAERAVMQRHTLIGHEMLGDSRNPLIQEAARIALTHHERWDGTGYPHGLRGTDIPLSGRIAALADVFDAITSRRVYREPASFGEALEFVRAQKGQQFDPAVVDAFLSSLDEVGAVSRPRAAPSESLHAEREGSRMTSMA